MENDIIETSKDTNTGGHIYYIANSEGEIYVGQDKQSGEGNKINRLVTHYRIAVKGAAEDGSGDDFRGSENLIAHTGAFQTYIQVFPIEGWRYENRFQEFCQTWGGYRYTTSGSPRMDFLEICWTYWAGRKMTRVNGQEGGQGTFFLTLKDEKGNISTQNNIYWKGGKGHIQDLFFPYTSTTVQTMTKKMILDFNGGKDSKGENKFIAAIVDSIGEDMELDAQALSEKLQGPMNTWLEEFTQKNQTIQITPRIDPKRLLAFSKNMTALYNNVISTSTGEGLVAQLTELFGDIISIKGSASIIKEVRRAILDKKGQQGKILYRKEKYKSVQTLPDIDIITNINSETPSWIQQTELPKIQKTIAPNVKAAYQNIMYGWFLNCVRRVVGSQEALTDVESQTRMIDIYYEFRNTEIKKYSYFQSNRLEYDKLFSQLISIVNNSNNVYKRTTKNHKRGEWKKTNIDFSQENIETMFNADYSLLPRAFSESDKAIIGNRRGPRAIKARYDNVLDTLSKPNTDTNTLSDTSISQSSSITKASDLSYY